MFKKFQDKLERLIQNQEPFLLFRKPNSTQVELWENKDFESDNKFICNSFDNTKLVEFNDNEVIDIGINELPNFELSLPESNKNEAISYENYIDLIQKTVEELQSDSPTKKIVISRINSLPETN